MAHCTGMILILSAALVLSTPHVLSASDVARQEPVLLAIHPYLPATELISRFSPLGEYISRKINRPVQIKVSKSYKSHITLIGEDRVDLAYMGSASYVKMVAAYGRKPLLARIEVNARPTFQGVVFVRDDSALLTLAELTGKRFAFGDPDSTMSHLVPRYVLWKAGVKVEDLARYVFLSNHHNVALGVLAGDFDAGAVKEEVYEEYEQRGLRVLMRTPPIPEYLFVARNSFPERQREELREALYDLSNTEDGRSVLASIKQSLTGMVPVKDEDYNYLREILHTLTAIGVRE